MNFNFYDRLIYLGYVSILSGHILKDNNTNLYELWVKDGPTFRLKSTANDMAFCEQVLQHDTESLIHLHQLAA